MAKTVRDARLDSRAARTRLAVRSKPYWRTIDPGTHLGYRKGKQGGRWLVRWYAGNERYREEVIGHADDGADADGVAIFNFAQAQAVARSRAAAFANAAAGLSVDRDKYTVGDAIQAYLQWMAHHRKSANDAHNRAHAFILPVLGDVPVRRLTPIRLRDWLNQLAKQPPRVRTSPGKPQQYRDTTHDPDSVRKRKATANRVLTTLKAALNMAWRDGLASDDSAWRKVKPFAQVDAARVDWLTVEECQRLMNASDPRLRALIQAGLVTGCRHGELARLVVADFNPTAGTLQIREAKSGKGRHVILTEEGIELFKRLTMGLNHDERLLSAEGGKPWTHNLNQRPLGEACEHARLGRRINFHILRHTYASLSVMAGMPLMVLAQNLGHRDTRMVEKHYGHLAPSYVAEAIRSTAPRFGLGTPSKVVPLR